MADQRNFANDALPGVANDAFGNIDAQVAKIEAAQRTLAKSPETAPERDAREYREREAARQARARAEFGGDLHAMDTHDAHKAQEAANARVMAAAVAAKANAITERKREAEAALHAAHRAFGQAAAAYHHAMGYANDAWPAKQDAIWAIMQKVKA